jgi:TonB family protein
MKAPMASIEQQQSPLELHLLADLSGVDRSRARWLQAGAGSVIVHIFLGLAAVGLAQLPAPEPRPVASPGVRQAVTLVAPRSLLTQREPNRAPIAREARLEDLITRAHAPSRPKLFAPPPGIRQSPAPKPLIAADGPQIQIAQAPPPALGALPDVNVPTIPAPAAPPPEQKPKLAFETPGTITGEPSATGRIPLPKGGIQEAMHSAAQGGPGGIAVGDVGASMPGLGMPTPGGPVRQASSLELLSDPMGVDFKPYLIRVLTAVRRNWFAVIPESARLGRRGKVVIQFSIDRSGHIPKLIIYTPSGADALDRAAVAGISASVPLPPLPDNYRGQEIRVQLAFFYNLPTR